MTNRGHRQTVTQPDNWLTYLEAGLEESKDNRQFVKVIYLDDGEWWNEWTAEQYQAWKEIYDPDPEPEPEDVEPITE